VSRGAAARPLLVPVATILRRPGVRHPFDADVDPGELRVGDTEVARGRSVHLDVVLEALGDEVTVTGEVRARFRGECRRCLEPVEGEVAADVQEIFERRPVEGETYPLDGEVADLEPMVRDAVLLALPLAPLCRPDCAGPAPERFPATGPAGEHPAPGGVATGPGEPGAAGGDGDDPPLDPRWAPLRQLDLG
jgi:uncharacterized protein